MCSRAAAAHAVRRWHYSRTMPAGKLLCLGAWEDEQFKGAVVFGRGATPSIYKSFGAAQTEMVELVRVALCPAADRRFPTTKAVAAALRTLRRVSPGVGLVVSFADLGTQGHHGVIYRAGNWQYLGESRAKLWFSKVTGEVVHPRTVVNWSKNDPRRRRLELREVVKLRYAYPLTAEWRRRIAHRVRPYPKSRG